MIKSLILSLVFTIIIELAVSLCMGVTAKKDIVAVICVNLCTNPLVVFISNLALIDSDKITYLFVLGLLELFAVFAEYILYKNNLEFKKISPFAVSVINNAVSFGVGLIL